MPQLAIIAFDADDTLWHTEHLYAEAKAAFLQLLSQYHPPEWIDSRLYDTEVKNLSHFGYGIKSYVLSTIETAIELSEGRVMGKEIQTLLEIGRSMIAADVELLDHASETVQQLSSAYPLMLVTKGDLFEQEGRITRSGLMQYFKYIEVVSDKTRATYEALLVKHSLTPEHFLMVGNSLRSDVWPVLELGGYAVYIPYHATWAHELGEEPPASQPRYWRLDNLGQLGELIERIEAQDLHFRVE
jgi:putative hydrolase of the HAD superfamily